MDEKGRPILRTIRKGNLSIIIGRLKGKTTTTAQAYRYPKEKWSANKARADCKEKGGKFEAAKKEEAKMAEPVKTWKDVELLRGGFTYFTKDGTWTPTAQTLQEIVKNAAGWEPPMLGDPAPDLTATLGPHHNERGFKSPRMGSVRNVRVEDGVLRGDFDPTEPLAKAIGAGHYPYLSIEAKKSRSRGWYLSHVSMLGTEPPAMQPQRRLAEEPGEEGVEPAALVCYGLTAEAGDVQLAVLQGPEVMPGEEIKPMTIAEQIVDEAIEDRKWKIESAFRRALDNILASPDLSFDGKKAKIALLLTELEAGLTDLAALTEGGLMPQDPKPAATAPEAAPAATAAPPGPGGPAPVIEARLSEADRALLDKAIEDNASLRRRLHLAEAAAVITMKVPAAKRPIAAELYAHLAEAGGIVKMGEGQEEKPALSLYKELIASFPDLVKLGETAPEAGGSETSAPPKATELSEAEKAWCAKSEIPEADFIAAKEGRIDEIGKQGVQAPAASAPAPGVTARAPEEVKV